jgi:hypothetical protein
MEDGVNAIRCASLALKSATCSHPYLMADSRMARLTWSVACVMEVPSRLSIARYAEPISAQPQPGLPWRRRESQSAGAPVDQIIPLMAALPPRTLPRSQVSCRWLGPTGCVG